jgi:hypothetical protein
MDYKSNDLTDLQFQESQRKLEDEHQARFTRNMKSFLGNPDNIHVLNVPPPKHAEDIIALLTSALTCASAGKIEEVALTVRYVGGRVDTMWSQTEDKHRIAASMIKSAFQRLGFNPDQD